MQSLREPGKVPFVKLKDLPKRAQARALSALYAETHPEYGLRGYELTQFFESVLNEAEYRDLISVLGSWKMRDGKETLVSIANERKKERTF